MKPPVLLACLALLLATPLFAQERASSFDAATARSTLMQEVKKPKLFSKSIAPDPVTKRIYTKNAVVVMRQSGAKQEHPYVPVPLLFKVNSDQLLDAASRENIGRLAVLLREIGGQDATFAIEGHASAEGDPGRNEELSNLRAMQIQSLLRREGVPAAVVVRVEGFGSRHAQHPASAPASQLQEDRRVLVVREK